MMHAGTANHTQQLMVDVHKLQQVSTTAASARKCQVTHFTFVNMSVVSPRLALSHSDPYHAIKSHTPDTEMSL